MDRLSALPGELIDKICAYLGEKRDLQFLRLCCKRLEETSHRAFDERHFGVVKVINTRKSLQRLVEVAREKRFQKAITTLEIYPIAFSRTARAYVDGKPVTLEETNELSGKFQKTKLSSSQKRALISNITNLERTRKARRRRILDSQKHDQNTMRATGADVDLLTEALRNLPVLKSIRTVDRIDPEKPPLTGKELQQEIGAIPPGYQCVEFLAALAHIITVIFSAIERSKYQLKALQFHELPHFLPLSQTPASRRLSRASTPAKTLAKDQLDLLKPSKLTHLSILSPIIEHETSEDISFESPIFWMGPLITRMTALRKLYLRGNWWEERLLRFLVYTDASLPQLVTLELRDLGFKHQELVLLLSKVAQTLKKFICLHCWSTDKTFTDILESLIDLLSMLHTQNLISRFDSGIRSEFIII